MPLLQQILADNLRKTRLAQGLSLSELADRAGIDRDSIVLLEDGTLGATVIMLGKLAHALGVEPATLLAKDGGRLVPHGIFRRIGMRRAANIRVGRKIRHSRRLHDLSREALAARLGLTFAQLRKYERGERRIRPELLVRIAATLDTRLSRLFEECRGAKPVNIAGYRPSCRHEHDQTFDESPDSETR